MWTRKPSIQFSLTGMPEIDATDYSDERPAEFTTDVTQPMIAAIERLNESEQGTFHSLDPRMINVERLTGGIFSAVVLLGSIVGCLVVAFTAGTGIGLWLSLAGLALLFLLLVWVTFWWPSIAYRYSSWRLGDEGLEFRSGVWWQHRVAVPWARVQHADVTQGPVQRMFGVGDLVVHTAGTANSSVSISGLAHETAIELRDDIIRQKRAGDVV